MLPNVSTRHVDHDAYHKYAETVYSYIKGLLQEADSHSMYHLYWALCVVMYKFKAKSARNVEETKLT